MNCHANVSKQEGISYLVPLTGMDENQVRKMMESPEGLTELGSYIVDFLCGEPSLKEEDYANEVLTLLTVMGGGIRYA